MLVATVADEFAGFEAEEVAAAVPLLAGSPVIVAIATVNWLQVDADVFQSCKQVGDLATHGLLSVNGDMEGLVVAVHDNRLVNHASVDIKHGEYHIEVDERLRLKRQLLENQVLHAWLGLQVFDDGFHAMHVGT